MYFGVISLPQLQLSKSQSQVDQLMMGLMEEKAVTENAKVNNLINSTLVILRNSILG